MQKLFKSLTFTIVLLFGLALTAHASTIAVDPPFSFTDVIFESASYKEPFKVEDAGTYKASIEDFGVNSILDEFNTLLFVITATTGLPSPTLIGAINGAGGEAMFTFEGTPGIQYYAHIVALLSPGAVAGGFGAEVRLIPIPPTLLLLGSGLVSLVVLRRRRG